MRRSIGAKLITGFIGVAALVLVAGIVGIFGVQRVSEAEKLVAQSQALQQATSVFHLG